MKFFHMICFLSISFALTGRGPSVLAGYDLAGGGRQHSMGITQLFMG